MNNKDGLILSLGEDGVWGIKEESYCTVELQTKEDYEKLEEMLEKQIPKKPIYKFTDSTGDMFYDCQVCGEYVTHSGTQAKKNFCSNCGQKLDWSVEE